MGRNFLLSTLIVRSSNLIYIFTFLKIDNDQREIT